MKGPEQTPEDLELERLKAEVLRKWDSWLLNLRLNMEYYPQLAVFQVLTFVFVCLFIFGVPLFCAGYFLSSLFHLLLHL